MREKLAKAREEWKADEKEHVRLVRMKCDTEYHEKLEEVVAERLLEKKVCLKLVILYYVFSVLFPQSTVELDLFPVPDSVVPYFRKSGLPKRKKEF